MSNELARWRNPDTKEWWRLIRSDHPDDVDLSIRDACALQSISERSLERGLCWAHACSISIRTNEIVTPDRVRAEMEAHLAMIPGAWAVTYETAVISRWATENGAWVAHDRAVIQGLDPDKLAVARMVP